MTPPRRSSGDSADVRRETAAARKLDDVGSRATYASGGHGGGGPGGGYGGASGHGGGGVGGGYGGGGGSDRPYGVEPPKSSSSSSYAARGPEWLSRPSGDCASLESLHLKAAGTATRDGTTLRDGNSRGIKADVAAAKPLPYLCDVCSSSSGSGGRSFLTATQLSDHLKQRHGVHKHPSLIRPTKQAGRAAAGAGEEDLNL